MPKEKKYNKIINTPVTDEMHEYVTELARENRRTIADMNRIIIEDSRKKEKRSFLNNIVEKDNEI